MKNLTKACFIAVLASLSLKAPSQTYTVNWGSCFSPSWASGNTSGSAPNIGGSSVTTSVTSSVTGGSSIFTLALGLLGVQSPTVSGATFTIPGSGSSNQFCVNFSSNTDTCFITINFSSLVTNVSFKIADIDKSTSNSTTYFDKVIITGKQGSTYYNPTITRYDISDPTFLVIAGNTATVNSVSGLAGNTASDAVDQKGTINVAFGGNSINSITIKYTNAAGADVNPASQAIGVGNISFQQSTLPVSLLNFSASQLNEKTIIKWATSSEINSDHFIIEKSIDNIHWTAIATVNAAGNSNSIINYKAEDPQLYSGMNYYRLKQVDIDGRFQYSAIATVYFKSTTTVSIYPNPIQSNTSVNIFSDKKTNLSMRLLSVSGQLIRKEKWNVDKGQNNKSLPQPDALLNGNYFIELTDEDGKLLYSAKLIKQ
jgi:hypothetical protein